MVGYFSRGFSYKMAVRNQRPSYQGWGLAELLTTLLRLPKIGRFQEPPEEVTLLTNEAIEILLVSAAADHCSQCDIDGDCEHNAARAVLTAKRCPDCRQFMEGGIDAADGDKIGCQG